MTAIFYVMKSKFYGSSFLFTQKKSPPIGEDL